MSDLDNETAALLRKYKAMMEPGKKAELRAVLLRRGIDPDYVPKKLKPGGPRPDGRTPPDYVRI